MTPIIYVKQKTGGVYINGLDGGYYVPHLFYFVIYFNNFHYSLMVIVRLVPKSFLS